MDRWRGSALHDEAVREEILGQPANVQAVVDRASQTLREWTPGTGGWILVSCSAGRHRSVTMTLVLHCWLRQVLQDDQVASFFTSLDKADFEAALEFWSTGVYGGMNSDKAMQHCSEHATVRQLGRPPAPLYTPAKRLPQRCLRCEELVHKLDEKAQFLLLLLLLLVLLSRCRCRLVNVVVAVVAVAFACGSFWCPGTRAPVVEFHGGQHRGAAAGRRFSLQFH